MSRALVLSLLAQFAAADLGVHLNNEFGVAVKAAADPGATACAAAEGLVSLCLSVPQFTAAPELVQAECLCCYSSTYIAPIYSSCASYISNSATRFSTESAAFMSLSAACSKDGGNKICTGGSGPAATGTGATVTSKATTATTSGATGTGKSPPGCTSFLSIFDSCSSKLGGFKTVHDDVAASCICYDGTTYTTAFDDYAASCAPYIKTADPTDYSFIRGLTDFCDNFPPMTSPATTPKPSKTGGSGLSPTTAAQGTDTPPTVTVVGTRPPNPAAQVVPGGPLVWLANVVTFILSFLL